MSKSQTKKKQKTAHRKIPGYDFGTKRTPKSPVTMDELRQLEAAVGWSEDDGKWLRVAAETLVPKAEKMVDEWRAVIASEPQLVAAFLKPDGKPDDAYKAAVKKRFVQWVSDLCLREHGQDWLNYQEEIGQRHIPAKKNKTDGGHTPPVVPMRYLVGFTAVIVNSLKPFLLDSGHSQGDLEHMQKAWTRGVLLSIALWTRAYTKKGLW